MRRLGIGGVLGLLLMLSLLSGCLTLVGSRPSGPWHEAYQPITDPESEVFVQQALAYAVELYGEPVIPVKKILLRRSRKTEEARRYHIAEDFSLTECADETNGLFVIYIGVDPDHENYYAYLGHECAHLLNPRITDWYMEGFATDFSERVCAKLDRNWGNWKRHFMRSRREPYALSYRMMMELREALPNAYAGLLGFSAPNTSREGWARIDIDAWLESLPIEQSDRALEIIDSYTKGLRRNRSRQYDFVVPQGLSN